MRWARAVSARLIEDESGESEMRAVIELAERLGKAIADSPAVANLHAARKAVDEHPEVSKLYERFLDQSARIAQLQTDQKPIEIDDKHKLEEIHEKLIASAEFKKYTAAQVEYVDMMRQVSEAIKSKLAGVEGA